MRRDPTARELVDLNARAELHLFARMSVDQVVQYLAQQQLLENRTPERTQPLDP